MMRVRGGSDSPRPGIDGSAEPLADRADVLGWVFWRSVAFGEGFEPGGTTKLVPEFAEEFWRAVKIGMTQASIDGPDDAAHSRGKVLAKGVEVAIDSRLEALAFVGKLRFFAARVM